MQIEYDKFGHGKPIVLLHAFPLTKRMWKDNVKLLTKSGFEFILPDLRFESDPENSLSDTAENLVAFLKSINIKKAIIGGLSMGGYVCLNMFRFCPEIFAGMILCDTNSSADSVEKRNSRFELIEKIEKQGSTVLTETVLPNLVSDFTKNHNCELYSLLETEINNIEPALHISALKAMAHRQDQDDLLSSIKIPTQIIFGKDDKVTDLIIAENLSRKISAAKLDIIPRAGHYSNLEQPVRFNEILSEFVVKVEF